MTLPASSPVLTRRRLLAFAATLGAPWPSIGRAAPPARIATLDDLSTELVVSLGIAPVASANLAAYRRHVRIGADLLADTVPLGTPQQPDLETLARARPDLIVGVEYLHQALLTRLSRIAPTRIYPVSLAPDARDAIAIGQTVLKDLGTYLGREAAAEAVIADCDDALAAARDVTTSLGLTARPLAVLYPLPQQALFIVSNQQTLIASLVPRLGMQPPWTLAAAHTLHRRIGIDALAAVPDLFTLFIGGQQKALVFGSPLWQALPVAQPDRHAFLDTPYWTFGGPVSAGRIATRMAATLATMRERRA